MPETILTIDDDELIRELIEHHLVSAGYRVVTAENGLNGVALAVSEDVDLVLCDLGLPDLSGVDVVSTLKARNVAAPVVIVSGMVDNRMHEELNAAGAAAYIIKPFMRQDLLSVVEKTLSGN